MNAPFSLLSGMAVTYGVGAIGYATGVSMISYDKIIDSHEYSTKTGGWEKTKSIGNTIIKGLGALFAAASTLLIALGSCFVCALGSRALFGAGSSVPPVAIVVAGLATLILCGRGIYRSL